MLSNLRTKSESQRTLETIVKVLAECLIKANDKTKQRLLRLIPDQLLAPVIVYMQRTFDLNQTLPSTGLIL
jgi:hypothetical protein